MNITIHVARKAAKAIEAFDGGECRILDWRDSGEGIRLVPAGDPYWLAMQEIPGLPEGTYLEVGYGSLGIYPC